MTLWDHYLHRRHSMESKLKPLDLLDTHVRENKTFKMCCAHQAGEDPSCSLHYRLESIVLPIWWSSLYGTMRLSAEGEIDEVEEEILVLLLSRSLSLGDQRVDLLSKVLTRKRVDLSHPTSSRVHLETVSKRVDRDRGSWIIVIAASRASFDMRARFNVSLRSFMD